MNGPRIDPVERLGLLPTGTAITYLTDGVRAGREVPPLSAVLRASQPMESGSARWEAGPVRELVEAAARRPGASRSETDAWLAPRLHATLRMTRAEAARPEVWNFLALAVAPGYVVWRHGRTPGPEAGAPAGVEPARFIGPPHLQAFARLWWAAEVFRDGPDYAPAESACRGEELLDTLLSLSVVDHKPTALAIARVAARWIETDEEQGAERTRALCTAVNVAGSALMYEEIAPDDVPFQDALLQWIADSETAPPVPRERLPEGPDDGTAPPDSVERLTKMFETFVVDGSPADGGDAMGGLPRGA